MAFAASVRSNTAQVPYSFVKEQSQFETALGKNRATPSSQKDGGGERTRTDDLLRARQALSQLSYTPKKTILGLSDPKADWLFCRPADAASSAEQVLIGGGGPKWS